MENRSTSIINAGIGPASKAPSGKTTFATPVKSKVVSTRPASAVKSTMAKPAIHIESNRPATARKADRAPFSPVSLNESIMSTASESREAAKQAKLKSEHDRIQKVAQLKSKWAAEKERKAAFHQARVAEERKRLLDETHQAAEQRRKNLEKQRELAQKEKMSEKELLASSLKARAQLAADLEAQSKAKRRISVFLNEQIRRKALTKQAELEEQRRKEEYFILENKRADYLSVREAKKEEEEKRRESMERKTAEAVEQKKKLDELTESKQLVEKALLETKYFNWQDDKAHKDAEDRARRESLTYRLDKWRAERSLQQANTEKEKLAREFEFELQTQAREDVMHYQESMKETRRQSLAYRLDKAKKEKDFEKGQKIVQDMLKEEERRLKELDRQELKEYKEKIQEARRQSMLYRSQLFREDKMRQEGEKQAELMATRQDYELRAQAWKDVQAYLEAQRKTARESLSQRLAEKHAQHELVMQEHEKKMRATHLDLLCRREDMLSMKEYKEEEEARRRKSISMRLQAWRETKLKEAKMKEKDEMQKEEDALFKEMDREELLAAKLTCEMMERKNALNSSLIL